jgi:hypothetical protein
MTILNSGFETAGQQPGEAEHWILVSSTSLESIAGFGPLPLLGWEGFDRWHEHLNELDDSELVLAFFDPAVEGYEDFEQAWDNDLYLTDLPTGHVVAAEFHGGTVEDLEDGWDNVPFAWSWGDVIEAAAIFDGEDRENFEDGWRNNEHFAWLWSGVSAEVVLFDGAATPAETFTGTWELATTI